MATPKVAKPPRERSGVPLAPEVDQGAPPVEPTAAQEAINRHRPGSVALAPEAETGSPVQAESPLPLIVWVKKGEIHVAANYAEGTRFMCGESMTDHALIKPTPGYPAEWCPGCQKMAQGRQLEAAR